MDMKRTIALVVFVMSTFLLMDSWQRQNSPLPAPQATTTSTTTAGSANSGVSSVPTPSQSSQATPQSTTPAHHAGKVAFAQRVKIQTDNYVAEIDTAGGDLRSLSLSNHANAEDNSKPLPLFKDKGEPFYIVQTGLLGEGLPNHNTVYTSTSTSYQLENGKDSVDVVLTAPEANGLKIEKVYTFHRHSYVIDIAYRITNNSTNPVSANAYYQFLRDSHSPPGDVAALQTFTGPAVYTDKNKFSKVSFSDIEKSKESYEKKANNGWVAMLQHYFVAAWLPKENVEREFYTKKLDGDLYTAGVIVPVNSIQPGTTANVAMPLYAGPQEIDKLTKLAPGLELVIDFGILKIVAMPIFKVLHFIYGWVGNWGIAIILLTLLIKLIFFPLQNKASRSMAQIKILAPKMQKLKEIHGDDRMKLQQATMELYKKEKINPLGGCLPIVIQIPVFIALYWVLLGSVELRHAPFFLWIKDLSASDPYFILPVIYVITMFVQMKIQPASPDPVQQKVMLAMPIVFGVMFLFFPAGLVLYWIVNNVVSIAQQWYINGQIEKESLAKNRS